MLRATINPLTSSGVSTIAAYTLHPGSISRCVTIQSMCQTRREDPSTCEIIESVVMNPWPWCKVEADSSHTGKFTECW